MLEQLSGDRFLVFAFYISLLLGGIYDELRLYFLKKYKTKDLL